MAEWLDRNLGPLAAEWHQGEVPAVEDVPWDCVLVLWSPGYIGLVFPWGDALNPLRWVNDGYHPQWGTDRPKGWWAYLCKGGAKERPPECKTWTESQYQIRGQGDGRQAGAAGEVGSPPLSGPDRGAAEET